MKDDNELEVEEGAEEDAGKIPLLGAKDVGRVESPAAGDLCFFRVFRDVSDANDTAAEDARLIGAKIFFTTDTGGDT